MLLQGDRLPNCGLQIRGATAGHVGLKLPHTLLQRADVAFYLIADAANHAGQDGVVGVRAEERDDLFLADFYEREFLGLVFQRSEAHLDARGDIAANVLVVSVYEVVRNGRTGVDNQQVFVGRKCVGAYGSSQTVLAQSLGRGVLVLQRNGRVVVEQDEVLAQPVQGVHHRRIDVDDRRDDAVGDGIERTDFLYLTRIKTLVYEVVNHLAIFGEDSQLGAAVSLVNTQIHGGRNG